MPEYSDHLIDLNGDPLEIPEPEPRVLQSFEAWQSWLTVAAEDVKVGDLIFNSAATHLAFQWVRVAEVSRDADGQIRIHTTAWDTIKHPKSAVAVCRFYFESSSVPIKSES